MPQVTREQLSGIRPMRKFQHPRGLPKAIAERTGIAQSTVSNIINGKQRPSIDQAVKLERVLYNLGIQIGFVTMTRHYEYGKVWDTWQGGQDLSRLAVRRKRRPRGGKAKGGGK